MILYETKRKDPDQGTQYIRLIVGTVESVSAVTFKGENRLAVKVVDRNGETACVLFGGGLKNQAEKANIAKGVWITVLALYLTPDGYAGKVLDFKYKGWWFLDSEHNGKKTKTNIFVGPITSPKKVSDKCFMVSMPLDVYDKTTRSVETVWKTIKFVNDQAPFAEKLLGRGTHYGAIVCGERFSSEYNGKTEYYYFGNKVELRLDFNINDGGEN